ncbi:MAG: inositol monophosphatase family protein [Deltaproteobacteria bacterium]|nr:inositol monophosphatase family protein [Deltaproteobacteria bacterium]
MDQLESQEIEHLMTFAMRVIQDAGKEALVSYGKGRADTRFDEELVTTTELRLTEYFQEQIYGQFPEHQIFLNRHQDEGYTHDKERYLWVFDPLDGVANFQGGIPIWGISLALLENAWPVFGICHMPATGDLFYARAGGAVYWGDVRIGEIDEPGVDDESVLFTYSRFHKHYRTHFPGKIRSLGSTSAHLCYVAGGQAEAAIVTHETFKDLAAVRVIVEAAGLRIYRMNGEEFFLNTYLDGSSIDEALLVVSPESRAGVMTSLEPLP